MAIVRVDSLYHAEVEAHDNTDMVVLTINPSAIDPDRTGRSVLLSPEAATKLAQGILQAAKEAGGR
jgi:hypothetical protein